MVTTPQALKLARAAALIADEKKGIGIVSLDVRNLTSVTDCFVFVGANSHIHVKSLEDAIRDRLREEGGEIKRVDGQRGHGWRVLDYGDLIVHIMEEAKREFYSLERLWAQAKVISLKKPPKKKTATRKKATKKKGKKK